MIKLVGISVALLLCSIVMREYNKTFALIVSLAGAVLMFASVSDKIYDIINQITDISSSVESSLSYIKLMLKVLGIILITQFVSDVCRDNGENALASLTEISAKIVVIAIIMPLFETVISIVSGLVK
jgi:stage III sporulation protein AD